MGIDEIYNYFSDLVNGVKPNGKFQLARIYGAYEREMEEIEKNKVIDERLSSSRRNYHIHRISDDMAIVEYREDIFKDGREIWFAPVYEDRISHILYKTFDESLIGLITMKTDNTRADEYIFKMLDME